MKKGDPPVMGLTKVTEGMTLEGMKRPWLKIPVSLEATAASLPATTPP